MGRAPCCEKVGLKRGRWTAEEDEILAKYIKANGEGSWRSLPKNAGLLRCGKSCRLRWMNYLRADVKRGNISKDEEETIVKLHASLGNRWSLIASHLSGRTDNEIKNYWNSHLSRTIHIFRRNGVDDTPVVVYHGKQSNGGKRRGGRTSRSAMKKKPIFGVNERREKQEKVSVLTTSTSEGSNMLLDFEPQQASSLTSEILDVGTLDLNNDDEIGLLSPNQMVDSGFWDEFEGGLFSANENSVSWGSEERESGVISSSEEREGEALVLNEGSDDGSLAYNEGGVITLESGVNCSSEERKGEALVLKEGSHDGSLAYNEGGVMTLDEEVGSIELEKMLDWDLDGMEAKLWDDVGEMWSWQWDSGNGEFELQGMEGSVFLEKPLDTWFLQDALQENCIIEQNFWARNSHLGAM